MLVTRGIGRGNSQGLISTFGLGISQISGGGGSSLKRKKKHKKIHTKQSIAPINPQYDYVESAAEVMFRHRREAIIAADRLAKKQRLLRESESRQAVARTQQSHSLEIHELSALAIDTAKENLFISDDEAALLMLMLSID